ncbi:hypothetical protein HZA44_03320 [Candidatus Peregrinibacteria bacterium]|nr:hypothetical protein [Candidatus Peregrinibacteria bacterium]
MRIKLYAFLALLVAMAVPYLLFAEGNPSITSFKHSGMFVPGAAFTITLGNVPDLSKLNPTVTLNGVALTVTSITKNTLQGKLPEGAIAKGNGLTVHYGTQTVEGYVAVPFISNLFLTKAEKNAQLNINGGNFAEKGCTVGLPNSTLTLGKSSQNQITTTIGAKLNGGDLTVTCDGLTSAPYHFDFTAPRIDFAENKEGLFPGSTLRLHGGGFSTTASENQILLDTTSLAITSLKPAEGLVVVTLPVENAKGSLKLVVNGIESNSLALDVSFPPILIDSKFSDSGDKLKIAVTGKYFSSDVSKTGLSIGAKKGTVKFANANSIEAEFPRGSYAGCLMVDVFGQTSNCLPFNTTKPPFLKGFQDPIYTEADNQFEWTLYAENLSEKNDKIAVYVNGTKASLKGRMLNRLTVKFDPIPDVGDVYVVSDGLESNRLPYDFGERFYPFISAAVSGGKFMYSQPIVIQGNNLGQQGFREKTKINLSGPGLTRDEKTKELEWKVTPAEITVRLDDKVKPGTKATLSVTVKGKKSNEVRFVTGQENKQSLCSPWIQKIQYPEGIMEGSTIRILGQCFNPVPEKNWVLFDTIAAKPTIAKSNVLEAKIPKGAMAKGKLTVKTELAQSNAADYISAGKTPNAFSFTFEDLGAKANTEIGREGLFAKLLIKNTLGEVEMQTLKFKFVYEDDKTNPNSVLKLGPLPFGEVKVAFNGVGKKIIAPLVIEREGTNTYSFILDGIRVQPSTEPQSLEFRTTVKPFALNGAKFHLEFEPSKIESFSGLLIQRDKQEVMKFKQNALSSATISISKTGITCVDSDAKKANCEKFTGGATTPVAPVAPTKPKLPSIPKK